MDLSEEQIQRILDNYKKKRIRENKYYHEVVKNKEDFILKNRARAKAHYEKNKDKKKEKYENNEDLISAKNLYKYYLKKDNVEKFKEKHETKFKMLSEKNLI